jgi:hypothetical protein
VKKLTQAKSQTASSTKYRTFSKAGITLICPGCAQTDTYQIGQFDNTKWAMHRHNHWCKDCRDKFHPVYLPSFHSSAEEPKSDLDTLMDMV